MEEHLESLKLVLDRLKECGIRIKKEQCDFLVDHVDHWDFWISTGGLDPLAEKIRLILEAPQPRNKEELGCFFGMNHEQEKAFQRAKCALTNPLVFTHFDSTQFIALACGASPYGVGALLSQKDKPEILKPVAYASRSLSAFERNHAQVDKEALTTRFDSVFSTTLSEKRSTYLGTLSFFLEFSEKMKQYLK
ncbi:hypothetical protein X801_02894 [Opisthorchis viverrini]|uniref:Reverse transcriptase/retrotransposon-derived protein RNase H-like domain-containing protein n=1 Tax=Opisthorchis viverrini TaxID=6198 RepID=A0A1S8X3E3_OPIVI|nr:hypothetical protein X801_02894 [Opisthorchis viverrini]